MKLCRNCYVPMVSVMSFSIDRNEKFSKCPKCKAESKHYKIKKDDLPFGEVIQRRK